MMEGGGRGRWAIIAHIRGIVKRKMPPNTTVNAGEQSGESDVREVFMKENNASKLAPEKKRALMLHINERLYQKGEISKTMYENAKMQILLTNK